MSNESLWNLLRSNINTLRLMLYGSSGKFAIMFHKHKACTDSGIKSQAFEFLVIIFGLYKISEQQLPQNVSAMQDNGHLAEPKPLSIIRETTAEQYIWMVSYFSTEGYWHYSGNGAGAVK